MKIYTNNRLQEVSLAQEELLGNIEKKIEEIKPNQSPNEPTPTRSPTEPSSPIPSTTTPIPSNA